MLQLTALSITMCDVQLRLIVCSQGANQVVSVGKEVVSASKDL